MDIFQVYRHVPACIYAKEFISLHTWALTFFIFACVRDSLFFCFLFIYTHRHTQSTTTNTTTSHTQPRTATTTGQRRVLGHVVSKSKVALLDESKRKEYTLCISLSISSSTSSSNTSRDNQH